MTVRLILISAVANLAYVGAMIIYFNVSTVRWPEWVDWVPIWAITAIASISMRIWGVKLFYMVFARVS